MVKCDTRASNGPNHLGLCALQDVLLLGGFCGWAAADWHANIEPAMTMVPDVVCSLNTPAAELLGATTTNVSCAAAFYATGPAATSLEQPTCSPCPGLTAVTDAAGVTVSYTGASCSAHGRCTGAGGTAVVAAENRCECERGYSGDACDESPPEEPHSFVPLIVVFIGLFCFGLMVCGLRLWEACRVQSAALFFVGSKDVMPEAVEQYCRIRGIGDDSVLQDEANTTKVGNP